MADPKKGDRVEIAPHYDLWMRGARFGEVRDVREHPDGKWYLIKLDKHRKAIWVDSFA